jgi:hypothetical protein
MPSGANARSKRSMSGCSLSPTRSWRCSNGIACLRARRSPAFLRRSIKLLSRRSVRSSSKTWWPDRLRKRGKTGWAVGSAGNPLSGLRHRWHPPGRPRKPPCPERISFRSPTAGSERSALRAIRDASEESTFARATRFYKPTRINGWGRSPGHRGLAMAITAVSCGRR